MGGYGSGRRCRSKRTTGESNRIDVRLLARTGSLVIGGSFRVAWKAEEGRNSQEIQYTVGQGRIELAYKTRTGQGKWTEQNYAVRIETVPCHFGGERVWFRCPVVGCGRRAGSLYFPNEIFACRRCQRLGYLSQRLSPSDRATARADAIIKRLGGVTCSLDPVPLRPKRMHRRTYQRLAFRYAIAQRTMGADFLRRFGVDLDSWNLI